MCVLSHVQLFVTLWTVAHQAPLSKGFLKQEYWSGMPFPSSGGLPNPGSERTLASPELAVGLFTTVLPGKPRLINCTSIKKKKIISETSLVVQRLGLRTSTAGREQVQPQVRELGSHMLHSATKNTTKQNHQEKKNLFSFFCLHWVLVASCRLLSLVGAYKLSCPAACEILFP